MATDAAPRLTLYRRGYCHMCNEMIAGLRRLQAGHLFEIKIVDVDRDTRSEQRCGEKVPMLTHCERELCHYFLDRAAVTAFLSNIR